MKQFASQLLNYYQQNARDLPWRHDITPYKVWLSEIMLQQTTVATVIPYFEKFLNAFPTVSHLAQAQEDDIMHLWQGLGYYSRARNLHKCAQFIHENGGEFPQTEGELLKLPGVGPYTAAAIASIAFNEKATVIDGNVERVVSRIFTINDKLPKAKPIFKAKAEQLTPNTKNALYSNAIMELGATICKPKNPKCDICPVNNLCTAFKAGNMEEFPKKEPKKAKKIDHGCVYITKDTSGNYYLQKRPDSGLLASLWEFPSKGWSGESVHKPAHIEQAEAEGYMAGQVRHIFTHIDLTLDVIIHEVETLTEGYPLESLPPLSTLMKKSLALALKNN